MSIVLHEGIDVDPMTDHDAVTELVFNQSGDGDTHALGSHETFDWSTIESGRSDRARSRLAAHGVHWDPDTGVITCPAGMDTAQVEAIWEETRSEADDWVLEVIDETRQGRPPEGAGRTAGHAWVLPL